MEFDGVVSVATDRATEGRLFKSVESRQIPLITEDEFVEAGSVSVSSSVGKNPLCTVPLRWQLRLEFPLCRIRFGEFQL
jgi:hypothetical protein